MRFPSLLLLPACLWQGVDAFTSIITKKTPSLLSSRRSNVVNFLSSDNNDILNDDNNDFGTILSNNVRSVMAASTILTTVAATTFLNPTLANAADSNKVELSTGSIIIKTSALPSTQTLLQTTEIDSTKLLKTLFQNRVEIKSSIGTITKTITDEISTRPVWKELAKELLTIEGDVLPEITVRGPADIKQTFKDVSKGKLNLLVNNEVINLSVEPTFTDNEDEIVFRIKGFKSVDNNAPTIIITPEEEKSEETNAFGTMMKNLQTFWDTPFYTSPSDVSITNGEMTIGGSILGIVASYVVSYQYYLDEIQRAEEEAEEKRKKIAATKKKKADEEKKKKEAAAAKDDEKAAKEAEAKKIAAEKKEAQKKAAEEAEAKKKATAAEAEAKRKAAEVEAEAKKTSTAEEEAKKWAAVAEEEKEEPDTEEVVKTRKHRFRFWKNKK